MRFMQRSPFAPALADALRDRIFTLEDSERQLHIVFLANDILFDRQRSTIQRKGETETCENPSFFFLLPVSRCLPRDDADSSKAASRAPPFDGPDLFPGSGAIIVERRSITLINFLFYISQLIVANKRLLNRIVEHECGSMGAALLPR
ncbi:hypothetical protein KSP39_PZI003368 [Platanthera zijinensis]|uniref:Uncharacterized protein n=1 Tax=Platanthera zijinensis TaxID=2320716 RepID=A0AAP0BWH4_9ASPA